MVAGWLRDYMFAGREDADQQAKAVAGHLNDASAHKRHFDPTGELLGFVGDGLSGPHGTATGLDGEFYVADTANGAIRTFTRN